MIPPPLQNVRGNWPTDTSPFLAMEWGAAVVADLSESQEQQPVSPPDEAHWSPATGPGRRCGKAHPVLAPDSRSQRRIEPRHHVDTSAIIHLISMAADVRGNIVDISLGGCGICTENRFPVGIFRRVEVEFRIDGLPFRLGGVTQAIYDPFNVGIRFLDLSDRKREQLLQLIAEIRKSEEHPDDPNP